MKKMAAPSVLSGGVMVQKGAAATTRMAILIWGAAGCGKSTFAATAPGQKLWLSIGDGEHRSVQHRDDVHVADYSHLETFELFKHCQNDNPFGLDDYLDKNKEIETVVCDSLTALTFIALQKSVKMGVGAGKGFMPSIEQPGISAYGGRNAIVLEVVKGLMRVTARHDVHLIMTAHEDDPELTKDGLVDHISVMLGGKIVNNMALRLSEIWYMSQAAHGDKERRIAVRATRLRKPMKTRMFRNSGDAEFVLAYDAEQPDTATHQMTIVDWHELWLDGGCKKLGLPRDTRPQKVKK